MDGGPPRGRSRQLDLPRRLTVAALLLQPSDTAVFRQADAGTVLVSCVLAAVVAVAVGTAVTLFLRWFARRTGLEVEWVRIWRSPVVVLFVVVALRTTLERAGPQRDWIDLLIQALDVAVIVNIGWILMVTLRTVERALLARHPASGLDDRATRHVRTQISLLRKVADALVVTGVVVASLFTIPEVREIGVGLLASAGVVGIVFGLAAQTSLSNLFAGIQIAFTDAIRVDDIVDIDGSYGRIEEITLTYVVVRVWNGTSLILPCTYFTTTPFHNWTHQRTDTMGTVELGLDWTVPVDDVRSALREAVSRSENWDGQVAELRVEDTSGPVVRLSAVVSAPDGDRCNALRWEVREALLSFVQRDHPEVVPRIAREGVRDG